MMRRLPAIWPLRIAAALVGAWLIVPTLVVIPLSFTDRATFQFPPPGWSLRYYREFFADPAWLGSLLNSLQLALMVTVAATVLGVAATFALVRGRFRGKSLINGALVAPMMVPGIIVAIAVYAAFLDWQLVGTPQGYVVAHTVLALPFVVITVSSTLRTFDRRLEQAAASLGAGPVATFRQVTLPLLAPGIASGAVFAFVTSFDEVVVSLFIQSPELQTLPVRMFTSVTTEIDPTIAAAASLIVVLTTLLVLLPQLLRRSRNAQ